ncbi:MAG: hypothetical protein A2138_19275 [Deltaproteobacteria bacterium RBG_16_71_12]|nr:MAG: hypothetical protein A2138_19275 [Deltaproteobacteria bacterium RBG_16_71_12]HJW75617.1 ethylbenzene dehydrogenase-related protein [Thermoleophilia bacterium]
MQRLRAILIAATLAWLAACATSSTTLVEQDPVAMTEVPVAKVEADLSAADPWAAYWNASRPAKFVLIAQQVVPPRPDRVTTDGIQVQAIHDGTRVAFRLRWPDAEPSEAGRLGEYSDAVALQFPVVNEQLPPVTMGAAGMPVHIFHWRAQYQRDAERGKPEITDLYPNASIDMYSMEFKDAAGGTQAEREQFNPGVALGNPQSFRKSGVDEILAEGFATSAVQAGHGAVARGEWRDGWWTVVIARPLVIDGASTLRAGAATSVAWAVWQGGEREVGSRKSVAINWVPLKVQ